MSATPELITRHQNALIGNYGKLPVVFARGKGSRLWDMDAKEYIDLFAGFGGTILGHCHPALMAAVEKQAHTLWQVGNQFYSEPQVLLAERLRAAAFDGQAFFCHSGAEAAEAAIKLARISSGGRHKMITMERAFHGRTLGALSATPGHAQDGFAPLLPGFVHVPFNNLEALVAAVDDRTAGVMLEPIQGEGGVHVADAAYLRGARELCDKRNVCLIFDEVWTGVGRTGEAFAYQHFDVTPDIMTLGKALGGGLPTGAILARGERAAFLKPGTHGCTLGGNPICAAVSAAVLETLKMENLPARAARLGAHARKRIDAFKSRQRIAEVRGMGLHLGIEMKDADATATVQAALNRGLIINVTRKNVIRLAPALTIPEDLLDSGLDILDAVLAA